MVPSPPPAVPTLFAPDVISSPANDGAPTFSPDGRTLYFERTNGKWSAILESHRTKGGGWSHPVLAAFSGTASDQQPAFSPDGTYMIFVSSRMSAGTRASGAQSISHLYRVDRASDGWSPPVELPPHVNRSKRVFKPSVARNGDLYFMADDSDGGSPRWRLFVARRAPGGYAVAEPLPFSKPGDGDVDPCIAPDQSYLVFSSNTRGEIRDGHEHLFMVRRKESGWSDPVALRYEGDTWGADDGEANLSPDGMRLYFTSSRVLPMPRARTRGETISGLQRMTTWDNGNNNVWSLSTGVIR